MTTIGYLKQTGENCFEGTVTGLLTWKGPVRLQPLTERISDNAPDMEIVEQSGVKIGTARYRTSQKSGDEYINLSFQHPQVTGGQVIFANLGKANDVDDEDTLAIIVN